MLKQLSFSLVIAFTLANPPCLFSSDAASSTPAAADSIPTETIVGLYEHLLATTQQYIRLAAPLAGAWSTSAAAEAFALTSALWKATLAHISPALDGLPPHLQKDTTTLVHRISAPFLYDLFAINGNLEHATSYSAKDATKLWNETSALIEPFFEKIEALLLECARKSGNTPNLDAATRAVLNNQIARGTQNQFLSCDGKQLLAWAAERTPLPKSVQVAVATTAIAKALARALPDSGVLGVASTTK